jgi:hypothetical protein
MSFEYLIENARYYTKLNSRDKIFDFWESPKFTLVPPYPPGGTPGKRPSSMVSSFMTMKITRPLPPGVSVNVYGGVMGSYSTVQSVQGVSYPNFQSDQGITPTATFVPGGKTEIVYSGPPAPNYGSEFNVISFQQTNSFTNIAPYVFYRVTFQNASGEDVSDFELDVTFNGAIIASE